MYQAIHVFPTSDPTEAHVLVGLMVRAAWSMYDLSQLPPLKEAIESPATVGYTLPDECVIGRKNAQGGGCVGGERQPCERPAAGFFSMYEVDGEDTRFIAQGMCAEHVQGLGDCPDLGQFSIYPKESTPPRRAPKGTGR